jgi:vacuolar protein sorting-associated protein 41
MSVSSSSEEKAVVLVDDEDETDEESEEGESDSENNSMPLLYYKRLLVGLPRLEQDAAVLSPQCTSCCMGKVVLNSNTTVTVQQQQHTKSDENNEHEINSSNTTLVVQEGQEIPVKQWQNKPVSIAVAGFQDGTVRVMDACTGTSILGDTVWSPTEGNTAKKAIVAVSLDASGTAISAIDEDGNCSVWTVKYSLQYRSTQQQQQQRPPSPQQQQQPKQGNILSKFFWKKETTSSETTLAEASQSAAPKDELVPTLTLAEVKVNRIQYPRKDFGIPTCLALDPAYKHKWITAFDSGKIVLSSRNWMRLEHTVLPYTGPVQHKDWRGIEAVTWRGSLMAFADCSGVKLYDTATLKPVAHVDRPTGARPSLYPGVVVSVKAHLCFETSHSLLVAWGDCLMTLTVTDCMETNQRTAAPPNTTAEVAAAAGANSPPLPTRKRTVACTMAWGLDCVATGVVPVDARHVAVLGLLFDSNEVELQVLDRTNGFVVHADLLELAEPKVSGRHSKTTVNIPDASSNYMLQSSFAVPRMEDAAELKEEKGIDVDSGLVAAIVAATGGTKLEFVDSHLKWNLEMVSFKNDSEAGDEEALGDDEADSVDSDDYGFVLRTPSIPATSECEELVPPPLLLVASSSDMVVARIRDVDDAIQFALEQKKTGLALRRALPRVRQLRRYKMNDLVNAYIRSVLRLSDDTEVDKLKTRHLSLQRMKLAAEALPFLLGGNVDMWEMWVSELAKIPGALFVVRNFLPVRGMSLLSCLIINTCSD